jgi:O-antigen/teichoic acid export membrane protein
MGSSFNTHYGLDRIRSTLTHFLLGKGFTVVCSVTVLLLLARGLSVAEFATLVLLQAIVNVVGLLSSFGATQTTVRYIPVLRAEGNNRPMYRMLFVSIAVRAAMIGVFLLSVLVISPYLARWIDFGNWLWLLPWYLIVGWLRLLSFFLQRLAESLLWQKASQYSLALAAAVKLAIVAWLVTVGELGLFEVVMAELASEALGVAVILVALVFGWARDPERDRGDISWLSQHRSRVFRYGLWSYTQVLAGSLYGSAPNRLVVSRYLTVQDLGLFGFVSALADLARRYLPTRLLQGIIRPLFFAKYAERKDFGDLVTMGDFNFRVSFILLAFPTVFLFVGGVPFLDWLTAGKYGAGAYLLSGIFCVLGLESFRSQLELLVQSAERNQILLSGNLILSASLLAAIPLMDFAGVWSLVIANALGNVLSIVWILAGLRRRGVVVRTRWDLILRVVAMASVAICAGWLLGHWLSHFLVGGIGALVLFAILLIAWAPLTSIERDQARRLFRKSRTRVEQDPNKRGP